ncbi:MAG: hypothetical protein VR64_24490 [Desulfatitalea sp. BRH_c12]|nr:MAG: hypothetical protein VR64_24490 [Desulfatitalea sp. BRH_c12]
MKIDGEAALPRVRVIQTHDYAHRHKQLPVPRFFERNWYRTPLRPTKRHLIKKGRNRTCLRTSGNDRPALYRGVAGWALPTTALLHHRFLTLIPPKHFGGHQSVHSYGTLNTANRRGDQY